MKTTIIWAIRAMPWMVAMLILPWNGKWEATADRPAVRDFAGWHWVWYKPAPMRIIGSNAIYTKRHASINKQVLCAECSVLLVASIVALCLGRRRVATPCHDQHCGICRSIIMQCGIEWGVVFACSVLLIIGVVMGGTFQAMFMSERNAHS